MLSKKPEASGSSASTNFVKVNPEDLGPQCQYPVRTCYQPVLENYNYCLKHILEDKNAPYRPCSYVYPIKNKRCGYAAPKSAKRDIGYCQMHLLKLDVKRQKSNVKNVPPMTFESLMSELSHYARPMRSSWSRQDSQDVQNPTITTSLNPFVNMDVSQASLRKVQALECASESDSDIEPATLETVWHGANEDSSDAESTASQVDDPLRNAAIYTGEEVVMLARNKMLRLQMLYQRQFDRLTGLLKESRREYLTALKREKEIYGPIHSFPRTSVKERRLYSKLSALNKYQRRSKRETVAYLSSLEKRAQMNGVGKPVGSKCVFNEGGVRCVSATLPLTKYCYKHILQDPNQCLWRPCGCQRADSVCEEPVMNLSAEETCSLHARFLPHPSATAAAATAAAAAAAAAALSESVKMELDNEKSGDVESELDASATESAISTDNRDSLDGGGGYDEGLFGETDRGERLDRGEIVEQSVIEEVVLDS